MPISVRWNFDSAALAKVVAKKQREIEKRLPALIEQQAKVVQEAWREGANGRVYPGMTKAFHSDAYQTDILRTDVVSVGNGASMVTVFSAGSTDPGNGKKFDLVATIEEGSEPRDMKEAILASPKAKVSKAGNRYMIIPFRHGAGESVHFKTNISETAKNVLKTNKELNNSTWKPNPRKPLVQQWHDLDRVMGPQKTKITSASGLGKTMGEAGEHTGVYTWQRRMYEGLRRYGAPGHGQYYTFRTVSDLSDPYSWIRPAVLPNPIFASVVRAMEPLVKRNIKNALER